MGKNKDKKKEVEETLKEELAEETPEEAHEIPIEGADDSQQEEAGQSAEGGESSEESKADDDGEKADGQEDSPKENAKKDSRDEKIAELNDKVVRQMAEFDNFRKRTEKEKSESFTNGEKVVIEAILPIIDNFERALDMASQDEEKKEDPFIEGMDKVYKQLLGELEKLGVKPIEALGVDFDPNLHNAVMQEETEEYESGKVCKELQKGYMLNDSVVRHSMVSVAQ